MKLKASNFHAQASVELLILLGVALLVILVSSFFATDFLSDLGRSHNTARATESVNRLAETANSVYSQGDGAWTTVAIQIPQGTTFGENSTYIGKPANAPSSVIGKTININLEGSDIASIAAVRVAGQFPSSPGTHVMKVASRGNYVSISPQLFYTETNSVFISMKRGENRSKLIYAYAVPSARMDVVATSSWSFVATNLTVSPQSFSLAANSSFVNLTFISNSNAGGIYSSQLKLFANSSGFNDSIFIPITLDIR